MTFSDLCSSTDFRFVSLVFTVIQVYMSPKERTSDSTRAYKEMNSTSLTNSCVYIKEHHEADFSKTSEILST